MLPNWLTTLIKAIFSIPAAGIMLTAALGILAIVLAVPTGLGPKAKIACYSIGIVVAISIVLYVWTVFQNVRIRERLSECQSKGTNLLEECVTRTQGSKPPPTNETDSWIKETSKYIKESLETGKLFRSIHRHLQTISPRLTSRLNAEEQAELDRIIYEFTTEDVDEKFTNEIKKSVETIEEFLKPHLKL